MAVSRALRRLLRVRELEEGQRRLELESALGELRALEQALERNTARGRAGRRLITEGIEKNEIAHRLAGLEEQSAAGRMATRLEQCMEPAAERVSDRRAAYLMTRTGRRQAETLIEETEARDARDALRRVQQELDDWHRGRLQRGGV
jgi:hypothetical protein